MSHLEYVADEAMALSPRLASLFTLETDIPLVDDGRTAETREVRTLSHALPVVRIYLRTCSQAGKLRHLEIRHE